ncbi:MFS transporter [Anaeromyxobacter diazotrophicus]|uniref:Integral membrane signal transducer protein n=1 Tax=Anaeromyxobacter diazotrophicus TaxID=2590199 RepID=A0A7I9VLM1_9BACT|nr:MFS transporter [Anaeromyxobacter diazotrophicus]GEJ57030.1 integral membrane signal transducer protein [Anaeromyxobacter diazotrophicus]
MTEARPSPPWIFSLTILPFAAAIGYVTIAAPFWLATRGVSLVAIGAMSATALAPHAFKFLWAPLLDLGARRRAWFAATSLLSAALLGALALLPAPEAHLGAFTALAFAANVAATTACAAADGLMAITTAPERKGAAAAWRMAGNVGGTNVLGALVLWVSKYSSVGVAGGALAALTAGSAVAALFIHEPRAAASAPGARLLAAAGRSLAAIGRDLWGMVRSREGWTGIVICAVPVGAGALTNIFSAMAPEYGASEDVVAMVNGLWGGLVGAGGSFLGGWLADRMNRRIAYAISGVLIAASALAMMAGPMTPATYTWGTLLYNFATGISFAALAAFVLEMVGHSVAAATKYTLFIAVANLAGSYVTALDGWASEFRHLGARGALAADAALTVAGIAVLAAMVWVTRRPRAATPEAVQA